MYLADFGIAKPAFARERTRTGMFVGTLDYASPEQIRSEPLSAATDIYALGCLLYQCLTGQVPFDRPEFLVVQAHLADPPPRPSEHGLPIALDSFRERYRVAAVVVKPVGGFRGLPVAVRCPRSSLSHRTRAELGSRATHGSERTEGGTRTVANYLLAYHGGKMPETKEAQAQAMAAWAPG